MRFSILHNNSVINIFEQPAPYNIRYWKTEVLLGLKNPEYILDVLKPFVSCLKFVGIGIIKRLQWHSRADDNDPPPPLCLQQLQSSRYVSFGIYPTQNALSLFKQIPSKWKRRSWTIHFLTIVKLSPLTLPIYHFNPRLHHTWINRNKNRT